LPDNGNGNIIERCWNDVKRAYITTVKKVLGNRKKNNKPWMSMDSCKEIDERKKLKKINDAKSRKTDKVVAVRMPGVIRKLAKRSPRKVGQ